MNTDVSLSLVVPAYNEAARITEPLCALAAWLQAQPGKSELIVVDDGSSDTTAETVRDLGRRLPIELHLLSYDQNRGKGYALKVGFGAARGERILFSDADLSTPIDEATRLLAALDECDIAIGSRKTEGSNIEVRQSRIREWMGMVFTSLVRSLIADVTDATCGFKAFRGDVGRHLFSLARVYDWSFDAELLLLARKQGYRLQEVAVRWADCSGTKVSVVRDAFFALLGLARIRWNAATGRYNRPHPQDQQPRHWCNRDS